MRRVTIRTGSRLHFGLFAVNASAERQFGGVGMMINEPGIELEVSIRGSSATRRDSVVGDCAETKFRIEEFLVRLEAPLPRDESVHVHVVRGIPGHAGFGSGTQTGLALARALNEIVTDTESSSHGTPGWDTQSMACAIGRGGRSAIGIHGFDSGGFLIDGGRTGCQRVGDLEARADWPEDWRVVLVRPRNSGGLHGDSETAAFRRLSPMPISLTETLRHLGTHRVFPAVIDEDFEAFATALDEFGNAVGDFFAPAQGGRYASTDTTKIAATLRALGERGIAQSSWGPTLCCMARDPEHATHLCRTIESQQTNCSAKIVRGRNSGAEVITHDSASV